MPKMRNFRSVCLVGGSLGAILSASPAMAQSSGGAIESTGISEVIVTAQRRTENVQDTPLSIVAVDSETLVDRGVDGAIGLNNIVPGLKIAYSGGQVQTYIRGVGDQSVNAYTQASVALNIDGVYVARSSAFGPIFFDIARVEVLRGPQGTLYGRNASGGAINILSNAPDLSGFSGNMVGEVGNYDLRRIQGVINAPVSDTFGLRLAAQLTHRDGYLSDGSNDDKSGAVRLRALWKPTDDLTFNLIAEYVQSWGKGPGRVYRPVLFGDPWTGAEDSRITPALFPALTVRHDNKWDMIYKGVVGQVDWDLGWSTLTVIPAWRYTDVDADLGADNVFVEFDHSIQKSLEVRLAGEAGPLQWVAGAYAFREDLSIYAFADTRTILTNSGIYSIHSLPQFDTVAKAVFGEGTFSVTDRLRLIGGIRYTSESVKRNGFVNPTTYVNGVPRLPSPIFTYVNQKKSDDAITWRAGVQYDLAEDNMLFATVSKGFKSGGFECCTTNGFDAEYVTAYTVGSKNRFFGNSVQLNLEGFLWKYNNQQVGFLGIDPQGNLNFLTKNVGKSEIYGVDADLTWRITSNDTLSLAAEYLHTKYTSFRYDTFGASPAGALLADGCVSEGPSPRLALHFVENCSGFPLTRAPKYSLNARYEHVIPLSTGGDITLGATAKHDSLSYLAVNYRSPNFRQRGYELYDLDVRYRHKDGLWSVQAYIRNITNKPVYVYSGNEASIAPTSGPLRGSINTIGPPRTYGVRAQYNF